MQQIYSRTPMPKCNLNKVARQKSLRHGCSPVNLLHIFRTPFFKNTSGWLLLRYNIRGAILKSAFAVASYKGGWRGVGRGRSYHVTLLFINFIVSLTWYCKSLYRIPLFPILMVFCLFCIY